MTTYDLNQNSIRFFAKWSTAIGILFVLAMAWLAWDTNFSQFGIWMMFITCGMVGFSIIRELCREISNLRKRVEGLERKVNSYE
jgi:Ca2+-dependent lipid-binding protein